jgi:hypothetical protein
MIFHSVIPLEIVMGNNDTQNNNFIEMQYMGEMVQATPIENNRYVIARLISTSPKAYLNPKLQPGTVIDRS